MHVRVVKINSYTDIIISIKCKLKRNNIIKLTRISRQIDGFFY